MSGRTPTTQRRHSGRTHRTGAWVTMGALALLVPTMGPTCLSESEPNDDAGTADLIRRGEVGNGGIDANTDEDFWRARNNAINDLIFAFVDGATGTPSTDTELFVIANDGTTAIEDDDTDGPGSSSVVAGAINPQAGNVFYRVVEDGQNSTIDDYELYQAVINPANTAAEVEANDTSATATNISAAIMTGNAAHGSGDLDFYKFRAAAGDTIVVIMDDNPDDDGSLTDTELDILSTNGATVLGAGDDGSTHDGNAAIGTATTTGNHFVRVTNGLASGAGSDSNYRFVVLVNGVVYQDTDGDMIGDTDDNCPLINNMAQADGDNDGVGDSCDNCPADFLKTEPGVCGCGQPDVDFDGDGVIDCGLADPALAMLSGVGLLLVPDQANNRVMAFDPADGDLVDPNFIPSDPANLPNPISALLGPNQNTVLVSDGTADVVQQYDLNGNYLGVFAPAGGANPAILDGPSGMAWRPNGNLVVGVTAGANANAVAEFDAAGNFVGNFIAPGAGGLVDPADIHFLGNGEALVSPANFVPATNPIHHYDAAGNPLANFADVEGIPQQLVERANGNVAAAVLIGADRGIVEYQPDGTHVGQVSPFEICNFIGLFELFDGNWMTTGLGLATSNPPGGAFTVDPAGTTVQTKIAHPDLDLVAIELVKQDADGDGVGDGIDPCPMDNPDDPDGDGICQSVDPCPVDPANDSDGDGVCDSVDVCPGADDTLDANTNGVPDCLEPAPPPPPQPAPGCCAPGVFPTVGLLAPAFLAGWTLRRRRRR